MMRILIFRATPSVVKQLRYNSSSSQAIAQVFTSTLCSGVSDKEKCEESLQLKNTKPPPKVKSQLVTAAFEQLKTLEVLDVNDAVNKMIIEAKSTKELLSIVSVKKLTRNHALKIVSVLADWTVEGRVTTADFEKDPQFVTICSILSNSRSRSPEKTPKAKNRTDLSSLIGVASEDEAAKLVSNITLSQMIKILSTLASRKQRSVPLLRSLAFNIASSSEKLDIKQGADALYAVACLNYHDEMLVDKICADLCECLKSNEKRAVVGSIITSLGLLRHKHIDVLNLLSEWVQAHMDICGPQDLTSLLLTLAMVSHIPTNQDTLFPMLLEQLKSGVLSPGNWLDVVWALAVLDKQTPEHVASVLAPEFTEKMKAFSQEGLTVPTRLKLLNINGVVKLRLKDYKGPLLDTTAEEWKVPLLRSKEKQALVTVVQETMLNLLPSAIYLATNIDTHMGFMIDGECLMNATLTPLPLFDKKTKMPIDRSGPDSQRGIKVAIMVLDYHDMTRGRREPTGVNMLYHELARLKGYRIMTVDYVDFNPRSKLVTQVQYLNQQLKAAIGGKS